MSTVGGLEHPIDPLADAPPEGWVAVVKPGRVMFELSGVPEELARDAMRLAGHKLPVKTKFVSKADA